MNDKTNTLTAVISDLESWISWKDDKKLFNKSSILHDDDLILEFSDNKKYMRIHPDYIKEDSIGHIFDEVIYMKNVIEYKDIKIGMLLVPNLDNFMLGNRWLVLEKKEDESFYCQHYSCGIRNPYVNSDWIIKEDIERDQRFWCKIGETLEQWQNKFKKIDEKNNTMNTELCDVETTGFDSDGMEHSSYCIKEKGHDGDHESKNGIDWPNYDKTTN